MIRTVVMQLLRQYKLCLKNQNQDWARMSGIWITQPDVEILCEERGLEQDDTMGRLS